MRTLVARNFFYILLFLLFFAGSEILFAEETTDEAQKITTIINKVIDAYGGKEVIENIDSLHAKGKIEAFMRHDHGTYELYFKRGKKLRVETKYEHSWEVRILNGDKGYRSSDTRSLEEVYGPRYLSMLYQYKHLDILHDLSKGAYQVRSAGRSSVNGNNVEVFRITDKDGAVMDICIDANNSRIVRVTAYFSEGNKQIDLSAEFSDFRKVGDSVFPFRIINYAGGMKTGQTVIEEYSLNPDMADFLFAPSLIHSL